MKAPNGFGGVTKLSGKRRRPFWVRITKDWEITPEGKAKQVYETLGYYETRKEALLALAEYHNNPTDLTKKDITFSEVWEIWTPKHFEQYPSSAAGLRSAYKKCEPLYNMKLADIKAAHLKKVLDSVSHMSEQTQVKIKTVIKNTFKYGLENDIITKDYSQFLTISNVKKKKATKYFTKEDLQKVFANLDFMVEFPTSKTTYANLNLTDSVLILLYTGMRIGELLEVKTEDIFFEKRYIHVRGTKTKNADRFVPIHMELEPILKRCMGSTYLIERAKDTPIAYNKYTKHFFIPFMQHLGLDFMPHALRHTFISLMDACGVSATSVTLKRIVGHSNDSVTEHYTHKEIEQLIEAIDRLKIL